jgi:hypothetical protein
MMLKWRYFSCPAKHEEEPSAQEALEVAGRREAGGQDPGVVGGALEDVMVG